MDLNEFLYNLHYETDKAKPVDWEADWSDAPLPYKLYRRLPVFPLSAEVPLSLTGRMSGKDMGLREFGHFLWYGYGMTQVTESAERIAVQPEPNSTSKMYRRVVPSGGALYPNEVYVYLKLPELPAGIYHYDVAHHRLALLREGNHDAYLEAALGDRIRLSECFGVVFVSTVFWKNFFKYHNFAYRLQGLDTGVALGQLAEATERFGYSAAVCFQFLDRPVNRLVGLHEGEESVYAVIPVSEKPVDSWFDPGRRPHREISAESLCAEVEELDHEQYVRSKKAAGYPKLVRMNEASRQETTGWFRQWRLPKPTFHGTAELRLPAANSPDYDWADLSRKRYSPEADYVLRAIEPERLAALLKGAAGVPGVRHDLGGTPAGLGSVSLYGCFYGVRGLEAGAYRYEPSRHSLVQVRSGDQRFRLQSGMLLHNVNLFQVPLCLHVAGYNDHLRAVWGWRGYRIQQMEAGMLVQRLLLISAALGMGGRPLLGYDVANADDLYRLPVSLQTALIQVPVGPYRNRARLEGYLHQ